MDFVIYVLHVLGHVQLAIKLKYNDILIQMINIYRQEIDGILKSLTGQKHEMNGFLGGFIMAMPFNMILILYVISSKLTCDFSKLTIFYIYLYIYFIIFMTLNTFLYVNKISDCMSVTFVHR